jgi:translocator protein
MKNPTLALIDIVILWLTILLTIKAFYPISKLAGNLLIPYFLWASFATLLNLMIVILN